MIQTQGAVAVWAAFAVLRTFVLGSHVVYDTLYTILACFLIFPRGFFLDLQDWKSKIRFDNVYITPTIACLILGVLAYYLQDLNCHWRSQRKGASRNKEYKEYKDKYTEPFKPYLIPARTSHTRLFPKQHSFSFSYLLVGVPIGWSSRSGKSLLSIDSTSSVTSGGRGWYDVDNQDYLHRGRRGSLRQKLDEYLNTQGRAVRDYPHAYLVTAPKFLGYAFNPVSFWYLYNENKVLSAMILEVNNTFDERRMYFLEQGVTPAATDRSSTRDAKDNLRKEIYSFSTKWPKDFHVSPFNSRKGSYSLVAHDPFLHLPGAPAINNTITLSSSKHHAKLIARIFSTSEAIDPSTLSTYGTFRFICSWWWVGFVTFPRIVREAAKLFWKRGLHVWFRPEVLPGSIGRHATKEEVVIEAVFRQWLLGLLNGTDGKLILRYTIPEGMEIASSNESLEKPAEFQKSQILGLAGQRDAVDNQGSVIVDLNITSPQFYTGLALAADMEQFFKSAFRVTDTNAQLCRCSDPSYFLELLRQCRTQLRSGLHPYFGKGSLPSKEDCRRAVSRSFLSEKIFFGAPVPLLSWLELGVRCCLYVITASACLRLTYLYFVHYRGSENRIAPLWISELEPKVGAVQMKETSYERMTADDWLDTARLTATLCSIHIWWASKEVFHYMINR